MARKCAFCGKSPPAVKISNEHVLRKKLGKLFPTPLPTSGRLRQANRNDITGRIETRDIHIPKNPFDMTVNDVCKACNEGWLDKEVEQPAETALMALMHGHPLEISSENARNLALWASKTAMVRGLMDRGQKVIPSSHYDYLMRNLAPSPGTYVWLAHIEYCSTVFTRHLRFGILPDNDTHRILVLPEDDQTGISLAHMTTFLLGHLGLYVVGVSEMTATEAIFTPELQTAWNAHPLLQIWPQVRFMDPNVPSFDWPCGQLTQERARSLSSFFVESIQG